MGTKKKLQIILQNIVDCFLLPPDVAADLLKNIIAILKNNEDSPKDSQNRH